ncbi:MAG: hypothetical protein RR386_05100 [Bacteroidaceae bacterium]
MNISLFISRFIYGIRYQLLFGSFITAALVAYFTQFLPKTYTVDTTVYTGIVSSTNVIDEGNVNYQEINSTYDNLINLLKSKTTLENVSLSLLATNLIYGDLKEDNVHLLAKNFNTLSKEVPDEVKALVDKHSIEKTIKRLKIYKRSSMNNYVYMLLNGDHTYYSFNALNKISAKRLGNSDMIEISYTSDDPGITTNTVKYISKELLNAYDNLRYRASNDAISYFEQQVKKQKKELHNLEIKLSNYNIANNIINYEEQTKATAISYSEYENRLESTRRDYESASHLLKMLDKQMGTYGKLMRTKENLLKGLDKITTLQAKITNLELFSGKSTSGKLELEAYKRKLEQANKAISGASTDLDTYQYSKEGVAIPDLVSQWLDALIRKTKSESELKVLINRKKEYVDQYKIFSPVGTEIKSREREISVIERTYLEMVDALNTAKLKKRNIQLSTAGLDTITAPEFPISPNSSKRILLIITAFLGSIIFISIYQLLIELLDRTLRDADRAERLTGLKTIGLFSGRNQLRYRGYSKTWNRRSAEYLCNRINSYISEEHTAVFNLLSIEQGEGKSYIAKFLIEEWEKLGLTIKYIKAGEDFLTDASYLLATNFFQLYKKEEEQQPNILLIEYPALQHTSIPPAFMLKASANLLIANACRVWKKSDEEMIAHINVLKKKAPFALCLNNTTREAVEDFTGDLSPFISANTFSRRMKHMGLTAKRTAIKRF